jgi:hypothetical protein
MICISLLMMLSMSMLMMLLPLSMNTNLPAYQSVQDDDEEIETEQARLTKTTWDEWNQVSTEDGDNGRTIDQIECTVDEEFSVKITDDEVKLLKDENGEIRY